MIYKMKQSLIFHTVDKNEKILFISLKYFKNVYISLKPNLVTDKIIN